MIAPPVILKKRLDSLYRRYNSRAFVHPDPLEFLYDYKDVRDREIVGFIAAGLAYGRVAQILKSVAVVLKPMGPSPRKWLDNTTPSAMRKVYRGFKHRFTTDDELVEVLMGLRGILSRHSSLNTCFVAGLDNKKEDIGAGLKHFVSEMGCCASGKKNSMVPDPAKNSACKRLHLYLRWMVRKDAVDPGGWKGIGARQLVIPLDTHMHKLGLALGLTKRKQGNLRTAQEITAAFRGLVPEDPVRYDFALTRLGIRSDTDMQAFVADCMERS